jgi:hypothetical protein
MREKMTFAFLVSLFLFVNISLALPCAFFGEVKLDSTLTNGSYVAAYYTNGTFISQGVEPTAGFGHYSIAVNAPDQYIILKIKDIAINQGNQFCENGEPKYLNISATTPLTTTTTTPATTTTSGGSSSGGSGGSGGGGDGSGSSGSTTTTATQTTNMPGSSGAVTTTTVPATTNTTMPATTESGENSSITGLIIGALNNPITALIVIILILIIIYIIWKMTRKKELKYSYATRRKK